RRRAALRAVEIDDVQPTRAERAIVLSERNGIEVVARLVPEVALEKAYAAAVAQVYGRNQLHETAAYTPMLIKFLRIAAPTPAERSGWNCVPKKFACSTTAENGPP